MKKEKLQKAFKYVRTHMQKKKWKTGVTCLAAVVVFCVVYALMLPAAAMEKAQCGIPEHTHSEACYTQVSSDTQKVPVCSMESQNLHTHTADCYDSENQLICGYADSVVHEHTADCYDANGNLICGKIEVPEHQHTEECFQQEETEGGKTLTCGLEEHTHTEECNIPVEMTEEEQTQVDKVIALIDALPTQEEVEETLASFENAGDEDGYDDYLTEIVTQAKAAYEAYSALTEAQQQQVTNAAKLMALEPFWSVQALNDFPVLTDDSARVTGITVTSIADGTAPWDGDDNAGNDSNAENKIVRTFDTVTYNFQVAMESYNNSISYSEGRVKLEFVLPLTSDQAVFDQGAMAWMDQTPGYAPEVNNETRDGVECQVLTCYKHLLPSEGHQSVVPGTFGENVTINVKSMINGATFAPTFSAAMEHGTWGTCENHREQEMFTVTANKVEVSAAPKYNIQIDGRSAYKNTFDFNSGNEIAKAYGEGYNKGQVVGRVAKVGVVLQLYNDNASKGVRGIELPKGDITFDLSLSSVYKNGSEEINLNENGYLPLLWSCDGNAWTGGGQCNSDGRVLYDTHGCAQAQAPLNQGGGQHACYDGGTWRATQEGDVIHVTVSNYTIDVNQMPLYNYDGGGNYGVDRGIGCFSAGEVWIVQPYNKIGDTGTNPGPKYDVVEEYGEGSFTLTVADMNMKATTVSGATFQDDEDTNNAQTVIKDDRFPVTLELTLPGILQNRVGYGNYDDVLGKGVGVDDCYNGLDFATVGTKLHLIGGFSYNTNSEKENILYWGTNLTKFYGSAIELTEDNKAGGTQPGLGYDFNGGASLPGGGQSISALYATKPDGTDWSSDYELLHTYEDGLVFYKSLSEIPGGQLCVGVLFCFKGPGPQESSDPYYWAFHTAKVRDNMDLSGKTFMIASTSRAWTKAMFEQADMTLDNMPNWTDGNTKLSDFPTNHLKSANIDNQRFYTKETYAKDGSGALGTHNSEWRHWGDTLLVIGYKAEITKAMPQQDGESASDKKTYNLDAGQRVVDFKLQPSTVYDKDSNSNFLTTTITIVDTLPYYLTYRPGSSYYGGEYVQTSFYGGTQGKIEGGVLKEPQVDPVLDQNGNKTGETRLTWVIQDVTVGEKIPAIYYSANIGNQKNPAEDVPTNTTPLVNKVRISATHDIRQPSSDNRNYAEVGLSVTRGAAASYGKYSKQDVVDIDGSIDYVIYYDNNGSTAEANPVLVDAMPYNGELGSSFSGTYSISSFKITLTGTDTSLSDLGASLSYTMDPVYAGKDLAFLQGQQSNPIGEWEDPITINGDGMVEELEGKMPVMWVLHCESLPPNRELRVEYTIDLKPEESSTLEEIKFVNAFSTGTTTTTTETPAVRRTLEGLTWKDDNADGIQDEGEEHISGVKVALLKLEESGDPKKESDYKPYCYPNTDIPVEIETGKQISVRVTPDENEVVTPAEYEPGHYKFTDLPAGTFAVRFTDGTGETKISPLIASPSNQGNNDRVDSDGIATYSDDQSQLEQTVILEIEMPKAEDMSVVLYESEYHDSGFYERGGELPETGGPGTWWYTFGGIALMAVALIYGSYRRRKGNR